MSEAIERAREAGRNAAAAHEEGAGNYATGAGEIAIDAFLSSLKEQAGVVHATVRDGGDEWHIECRMADGQKGAFITVDKEFEALADVVAAMISAHKGE
jgi:hypothetical protein